MHDRWTITRAEFDGWFARLAPGWRSTAGAVLAIGGLATLATVFMTRTESAPMRYLLPVLALLGVAALVRASRRFHHLHRSAARIWDEGGAACPKCHETLRDEACVHGLTRDDADAARSYWEAAVRGDAAATNHALAALARGERPRGALGRPFAAWRRARRWAAASTLDPDKPIWKRLVASIFGFGITMGFVMTGVDWAISGAAPTPAGVIPRILFFGLMFGGLTMAGVAWAGVRAGRNHCSACGHLIAAGHESRPCAECGADLAQPGSVSSSEKRRDGRTAAIGASIALAAVAAPLLFSTSLFIGSMPTRLLLLQHVLGSPALRFRITEELTTRTLDAETTAAFADILIDGASSRDTNPLSGSSFIGRAVLSGKLDADRTDRALRASVSMRIEAPDRVRAGEPFQATIVPVFGSDLFQLTHSMAVAWEGLEIDHEADDEADHKADDESDDQTVGKASGRTDGRPHGKPLGAAPRFFTEFDMNPARSAPVRPKPVTVTLEARGEHTLRVRAWVVLLPLGAQRQPPVFDAEGQLVPPEGTVAATEIVVEKALRVE